ncbi:MAG: alpha-amylase family glycosyl hydrolase [Metamycoplasmataceae bacterium]
MLNKRSNKLIFYEVNPLFFYDSNDDGYGDFNGISKKIDYFSFIDIDCVIIPDIFNNYSELMLSEFVEFKNKYGKIDDIKNMIANFEAKKINFAVEINIKDIKKSLLFSRNGIIDNEQFGESKKAFFLHINQSENQSENWNSKKSIESFKKIIRFWTSLNVTNFVFVNFERLFNKNEVFSTTSKEQLSELYKLTKNINLNATIILKSGLLTPENISACLKEIPKVADYFIDTSYSLLGTNPKTKNDLIEKFKPSKLFKKIEKATLDNNLNHNIIMSLGSSLSGRINSRWGDEKSFNSLASKAFLAVSQLSPSSSLIYYGDELGTLKIDMKNIHDFHDIYAIERKRLMQSQGQRGGDFFNAQQYLSPINTQSLFQWDNSINGGFSKGKVTIRKISSTYKNINVAKQYNDFDSSLYFLKTLIEFTRNPIYRSFFNDDKATIKVTLISQAVIKYSYKLNDEKLYVFINVSKNWRNVNISEKLIVVLSNYSNKTYNNKIKMLAPFETIILFPKKEYNQ